MSFIYNLISVKFNLFAIKDCRQLQIHLIKKRILTFRYFFLLKSSKKTMQICADNKREMLLTGSNSFWISWYLISIIFYWDLIDLGTTWLSEKIWDYPPVMDKTPQNMPQISNSQLSYCYKAFSGMIEPWQPFWWFSVMVDIQVGQQHDQTDHRWPPKVPTTQTGILNFPQCSDVLLSLTLRGFSLTSCKIIYFIPHSKNS